MLKHCVNHLKALAIPTLPNASNIMFQQTRNTYILRRKYKPKLHPKGQKPYPLKARNFIYELVENTNIKPREPIKLILTSNVKDVGVTGDIISLKPVKAYTYFLLPKLAVYATPENIKKYDAKETVVEKKPEKLQCPPAIRTLQRLEKCCLLVLMSKEIPWVLEPWHIKTNFRRIGYHMPLDAITLPSRDICGPDKNIEGKDFYVTVTINQTDRVKVRCRIQYWSKMKSMSMPKNFNPYETPAEPLFEDDAEILNSMPTM